MTSRRTRPNQWICTARFTADVEGERIFALARIGRPKKQRVDWGCRLFISNIGMKKPVVVVGIDPMQSILLAFEGILTTIAGRPVMAEGSRSRTYQEAFDAPSWV